MAICGPSGSGKSYLVRGFTNCVALSTDDFYFGKSQMQPDASGIYNYDRPEAVDLVACGEAVKALATLEPGRRVSIPRYSMKTSERVGMRELIVPDEKATVVVEGIFSFHPPLLELADFRIFMDPPPWIILARRYKRDIEERGRSVEDILQQYPTVIRGYEQYIAPVRQFADLIIDFGILV